jgi:hypothetical protein
MPTAQKLGVMVIGLAMLTVATLPDSKFAAGVTALFQGGTGLLGQAMGRGLR